MANTAHRRLRSLQKALYDKAYAEALPLVTGGSPAIIAYSNKFEASLPSSYEKTTIREILDTIRASSFILYGDFHTLKQSQRGLVRLLRAYIERYSRKSLVLAVEMFKSVDQPFLDRYLQGRILDQELLQATGYAKEWGFSWPNYKMVLDFAKEYALPVVGINSANSGRDTLTARDRFAANILLNTASVYNKHNIVCMIGEYHLADDHLPAALSQEMSSRGLDYRVTRVLTNVDRFFFELHHASPNAANTEFLKLKDDLYCIMNSPPWMKWQSYAIWEEMRGAGDLPITEDDDEELDQAEDYTEQTFDMDYQVYGLLKHLANFLGVQVSERELTKFNIISSPTGDFSDELSTHTDLDADEIERIVERTVIDGVYFLPRTHTILVAEISINNMAECAGEFLHTVLSRFTEQAEEEAEAFYRRVLKYAVGMLASKILNPRRKCPHVTQFKSWLQQHKGRRLIGRLRMKRETAKAVIEHHKWMLERYKKGPSPLGRGMPALYIKDNDNSFEISRAIGQFVGDSLYRNVMTNQVGTDLVRNLFKYNLDTTHKVWQMASGLYRLTLKD